MARPGLALLGLLLCAAVHAGPADLWGPQEEPAAHQYQKLCDKARTVLDSPRDASSEVLRGVISMLRQATQIHPDGAEGWALLGRALLETGDPDEARPALEAAVRRGAGDSRLLLGLALLKAQQGDLEGALDLYLRLQQRGMTTPLLYRRTGDVQMALGRLGEAMESYRRACPVHRPGYLSIEGARACFALAVASDRDGRLQQSAAALRRGLAADPALRALDGGDFVPPADRAYYQALVAEARGMPRCARVAPLIAYVRAATAGPLRAATDPATGRPGGAQAAWTGRSYAERARERLDRLGRPDRSDRPDRGEPGDALDRLGAACKTEYSAAESTDP